MKTPSFNVFLIQQEDAEVPSTTAIITIDGKRSDPASRVYFPNIAKILYSYN
jgi:hypothetical protein